MAGRYAMVGAGRIQSSTKVPIFTTVGTLARLHHYKLAEESHGAVFVATDDRPLPAKSCFQGTSVKKETTNFWIHH
jgi:hypothetical protein